METTIKTALTKLKAFLTRWDAFWSVPLAVGVFLFALFAGEAIFGAGFGGYSPGFIHAVLFAALVLVVLNTVAQLGLKLNIPTLWNYFAEDSEVEGAKLADTLFTKDFQNLAAWQRVAIYLSVYFLYLILGVVIVALLV